MDYLLDTHVLLWYINGDPRLSELHKTLIEDPEKRISLSYVSLWEMTIKISLGKLEISGDLKDLINLLNETDIFLINIEAADLIELQGLVYHHRDPFDRLLVSQAKARSLILLSADKQLSSYEDLISIL